MTRPSPDLYQAIPGIPLSSLSEEIEDELPDPEEFEESSATWPNVLTLISRGLPEDLLCRRNIEPALLYISTLPRRGLLLLVPSFISARREPKDANPSKLPETAYLSGVRGVAAWCVWCQHFLNEFYYNEPNWGYHSRPQDVWIHQLPFIRLIYSGSFMVTIFFVLSGFVLSYKPLEYARSHDHEALFKSLGSSVFRRGARLFLPCLPPLIIMAILVHLGVVRTLGVVVTSNHTLVFGDIADAFGYWMELLNFFNMKAVFPPTVPAQWTLPFEFRGSILVFVCVLGLARLASPLRIAALACLCLFFLYNTNWQTFTFVAGIILAELRHIRNEWKEQQEDCTSNSKHAQDCKKLRRVLWVMTLIVALFLGSFPLLGSASTPGYQTLTAITPQNFGEGDFNRMIFWACIGAVLLLLSLENFPPLQTPFVTPFVQYMGDISFSLYLVQFPIIYTIGSPTFSLLLSIVGVRSVALILGNILLTPVLILISDLQWRLVDMNTIKLTGWLYAKVSQGR